jgi:hypothetical protein
MGKTMLNEIFNSKENILQTPLDEAERAITSRDIDALAVAALKVVRLAPYQRYLAEPLHEIGKHLALDVSRMPGAVYAASTAGQK